MQLHKKIPLQKMTYKNFFPIHTTSLLTIFLHICYSTNNKYIFATLYYNQKPISLLNISKTDFISDIGIKVSKIKAFYQHFHLSPAHSITKLINCHKISINCAFLKSLF